MRDLIRTALIGRGMAATVFHRPLLAASPHFALAGLYGSANAAQAMADPAVDLVVIATPNATHFDLARQALAAGKHVVIDKPAVLRTEDADILAALAAASDRIVVPFHNRRWDGDFLTAWDILASNRLGDIRLFTAHWDRFRPMRKGGWREEAGEGAGLLWDLGPHMIDQLLLLFGWPDAVQADLAVQRGGAQADDYFELTFAYGARRAIVGATTIVTPPRSRFALYGTAGSFVKHGLDPQEGALKRGVHPNEAGAGDDGAPGFLVDAEGHGAIVPTKAGGYAGFYDALAQAVQGEAPAPVPLQAARDVARLILAARDSAAAGRAVTLDRGGSSASKDEKRAADRSAARSGPA